MSSPIALLLLLATFSIANAQNVICPRLGTTESSVQLQSTDSNGPNFNEISGLAISPTQLAPVSGAPILYAVSDGGGGKRLGVFDSASGERLVTLRLDSVPSDMDWEDLTIGSCGTNNVTVIKDETEEPGTCIFIADLGDNLAQTSAGTQSRRDGVPYRIFKVKEPTIANYLDNEVIPAADIVVMELNYNHSTSPTVYANAEAVFIDHTGWGGEVGDLNILTKWGVRSEALTRLFRIPASEWYRNNNGSDNYFTYSPATVGNYNQGEISIAGHLWTMADMSLDGTLISIGDYDGVYLFPRCPGTSVADALIGVGLQSCVEWTHEITQEANHHETFAWTPDGLRNLVISECATICDPVMYWSTMDYNNPANIHQCETFVVETMIPSDAPSLVPSDLPTLVPSMTLIQPSDVASSSFPTSVSEDFVPSTTSSPTESLASMPSPSDDSSAEPTASTAAVSMHWEASPVFVAAMFVMLILNIH